MSLKPPWLHKNLMRRVTDRSKISCIIFLTLTNWFGFGSEGESMPQHTCGSQWTTCGSWFFLFSMWFLEPALSLLDLTVSRHLYPLSHLACPCVRCWGPIGHWVVLSALWFFSGTCIFRVPGSLCPLSWYMCSLLFLHPLGSLGWECWRCAG